MNAKERKAVAETLREWAAWCEQSEWNDWYAWQVVGGPAWKAAFPFCEDLNINGRDGWYSGPTAALGLYFAAAMVEAGDLA